MEMGFPWHSKEKLFPILISRTVTFLFIMCLLTIFLYAVGTIQGFVDSTQLSLLRLYVFLGIFLCPVSLLGMILSLRFYYKTKKIRYILRAAAYFFLLLFGIGTVLVFTFIMTILTGNGV